MAHSIFLLKSITLEAGTWGHNGHLEKGRRALNSQEMETWDPRRTVPSTGKLNK